MKIGLSLPLMDPGLDRKLLQTWAQTIDEAPFSSLAIGERIAFGNPEALTMLAACAAWTQRVQLCTTVLVPALHHPTVLAKQLATIDMLSEGRLTVGLGVGGREQDYRAAGADLACRKQADLSQRVAAMRQVWAGINPEDGIAAVGPAPLQPNGPRLLAGAQGPKAIAAAAQWADGLAGFSFGPDPREIADSFELTRQSWQQAGRETTPRLVTSFWFALGDPSRARQQLQNHLRHYLNWLPASVLDALLPQTGFAGTAEQLRETLQAIKTAGADEVILVPTSPNTAQLNSLLPLLDGVSL